MEPEIPSPQMDIALKTIVFFSYFTMDGVIIIMSLFGFGVLSAGKMLSE